jgi:hypothetical protein
MKKAVVFVVLAMALAGSCAAQSASNDAQRIVGTWTLEVDKGGNLPNGTVWVFNANGTVTVSTSSENSFWGISASGEIYIVGEGAMKFFMSPDGKRMIVTSGRSPIILQKK